MSCFLSKLKFKKKKLKLLKYVKNIFDKLCNYSFPPKQSLTCFIIKKVLKNPILTGNKMFPHLASWQSMADKDVLIKKITSVRMD